MLIFICNVIFWVLFVYGFLSLAQDIFNEVTYKKINHDMKIFVLTKNLYGKLDEFINEFNLLKKCMVNKNVSLINLSENDDFDYIDNKLKKEEINWKFLNFKDGKKLILNQFQKIEFD